MARFDAGTGQESGDLNLDVVVSLIVVKDIYSKQSKDMPNGPVEAEAKSIIVIKIMINRDIYRTIWFRDYLD